MTTPRSSFAGPRLRLARAFNGWTQRELGERVGVTHSFVAHLEGGHKVPTSAFCETLAMATGFESSFFGGAPLDEFTEEECHFRRRSSTPVSVRMRVLAHGTLFGQLVSLLDDTLTLPPDSVPMLQAHSREEIETAAESCRVRWGVGRELPIPNLTRAVERAGVVVTRFEGLSAKVDAFSRASRRSVVVLNTEKQSSSRTRFDLAHECGHLVLHGGHTTGDPETEREADCFAGALLLPRGGLVGEFPRGPRIDWSAVFRLKQRWRTSASALIRRAYDLRLLDAGLYQRAYKHMATQGWLKGEPEEFEGERPELVPLAIAALGEVHGCPPRALSRRLAWQPTTFQRVSGVDVGAERSAPLQQPSNLVQLEMFRANKAERSQP